MTCPNHPILLGQMVCNQKALLLLRLLCVYPFPFCFEVSDQFTLPAPPMQVSAVDPPSGATQRSWSKYPCFCVHCRVTGEPHKYPHIPYLPARTTSESSASSFIPSSGVSFTPCPLHTKQGKVSWAPVLRYPFPAHALHWLCKINIRPVYHNPRRLRISSLAASPRFAIRSSTRTRLAGSILRGISTLVPDSGILAFAMAFAPFAAISMWASV